MKNEVEELKDWFDELAMSATESKPSGDDIIIDDNIKNRLYPLRQDEYDVLEQSILDEGCREPLIVWNGILIDGHNRYSICKKHNIFFKIVTKNFIDMDTALRWIDLNQYGRRNLTDMQMADLRGRYYNSIKQSHGGDRSSAQNAHLKTGDIASEKFKVDPGTIRRDAVFSESIDELKRSVGVDVVNTILAGDLKISKHDIVKIADMDPFEQEKIITKIKLGDVANLKEANKLLKKENRDVAELFIDNDFVCGDAVDILKTLDDKSIGCCVMDPPYGIAYKDTRKSFNPIYEDETDYAFELLDNTCAELSRVLTDDAHIYVFSASGENACKFRDILNKYFIVERNQLIWVKNNHTLCDFSKHYAAKHEFIFFCKNKNEDRLLNNDCSPDVLSYSIPRDKVHSAQKPIDLIEYLISNSTIEGEVVIDPFAGSATTLIAAKGLGRGYFGIEKNKEIHSIGLERIKNG